MATYIIADLHLTPENEKLTCLFEKFALTLKENDSLYILGDLFAYYVGLDPQNSAQDRVRKAISKLKELNIDCYFIQGNRDFLLNNKDALWFGFKLLPACYVIGHLGRKILLLHGDELCTEKKLYQLFRSFSRIRIFQKIFFLITTHEKRVKIAENMRIKSQRRFHETNCRMEKINFPLAQKYLKKYQANIMVHGHTHCADIHSEHDITICDTGNWNDDSFTYIKLSESAPPQLIKVDTEGY